VIEIMPSDDDQIVPIADSALLSAKTVKGTMLKVYKGAHTVVAWLRNSGRESWMRVCSEPGMTCPIR
jgi:hypothetical protein